MAYIETQNNDDFNNEQKDRFIEENVNYYQNLLNSPENDDQLESEFTQKINNEVEEDSNNKDEEVVRDWQGAIIEEVRKYPCLWNTKSKLSAFS